MKLERIIVCIALLTVTSCAIAQQPGTDQPKFKGSADLANTVQISTDFSRDGQSATVLFRNLEAAVGGLQGGPLVDTRTVTVVLPIDTKGKDVPLRYIVRGYVNNTAGARAVLLVQAAGRTTLVDLKDAKGQGTDFLQAIDGTVPAGGSDQITFFLIAERDLDRAEVSAVLNVDSLDVTLVKP